MHDTAIHLDENVLPQKPIRQWVLSFPFFIRYLMAYDPDITTRILRIFQSEIAKFYQSRTKKTFGVQVAKTGAVTVIQRFGGALNINPHFHSLLIEGSYFKKNGILHFHRGHGPSPQELESILHRVIGRVIRYLTQISCIEGEQSTDNLKQNELIDIHSQSVVYRIAVGKRKGEKVELFGYSVEEKRERKQSGVSINGFNIHAGVFIPEKKRDKLMTLCRYIARGPISKQRLERVSDEKVAIRFKKAWSNGATHVVYTNTEFIEKLVALVPPPRANLVRYFGVFAPRCKWRKEVVPTQKIIDGYPQERVYRVSWAELLKRTFGIDAEKCKVCGGRVEAIDILMNPGFIQALLAELGVESKIVKMPALSYRGPPPEDTTDPDNEFNQAPADW